jgi:hypothetical protein
MNDAHVQRLLQAFPTLYRDHAAPLTGSLMAFGFDCGDGWADLLHDLSQKLTTHAKEAGLDIVAVQVKEKWGELVVYADGTDDEADRLIEAAREASTRVCEECGAPGRLYRVGWHQTRCLTHAPERRQATRAQQQG